jgi:lysozyme
MASELKLSLAGTAFIAQFEGFHATAYRCPAGRPTIGYGHVIRAGEYFEAVGQEQALVLLQRDAEREAAPVSRALDRTLTSYQQDALISLAFNCGGTAIAISHLVRQLNQGLFSDAADEFLRWDKATVKGRKVVLPGLVRRREAERKLFLMGEYA